MLDIARRIGAGAAGVGTVILLLVIPIVILLSFLRYGSTLASFVTLGLPILIVLGLIPSTRGFASVGFLFCAYIFGTVAWVEALRAVWQLWGGFAAFIGFMFGGFGHVPMAFVATAFSKRWDLLGSIVLLGILALVCQLAFAWLSVLADKRQAATPHDAAAN